MQKSRVNWLTFRDRNTKFYHTITARKRICRRIQGVENNQGQWIEQHEGISNTFTRHFKELYKENDTMDEQALKVSIQSLKIPLLNNAHKEVLNKPFKSQGN